MFRQGGHQVKNGDSGGDMKAKSSGGDGDMKVMWW